MRRQSTIDHRIAALASRQGGRVSREQLLALGLGPGAIDHRRAAGRLHVDARGVYAVGHRHQCGDAARWTALLACGPDAVLSHRSAAAVWAMLPHPATVVHVTLAGERGRKRRRDGIRTHRSVVPSGERTVRHGLRVTTFARTLLDIAATEPTRVVEQALDGADTARILDMRAIDAIAPPGSTRPGAVPLRAILRRHHPGTTITKSGLEEIMLGLNRRHGLPPAVCNTYVEGWEVDVVWHRERLAIEVQSTTFHATSQRIARDAEKEADLMAAGWQVLHVADRHLLHEPERVAQRVLGVMRRMTMVP